MDLKLLRGTQLKNNTLYILTWNLLFLSLRCLDAYVNCLAKNFHLSSPWTAKFSLTSFFSLYSFYLPTDLLSTSLRNSSRLIFPSSACREQNIISHLKWAKYYIILEVWGLLGPQLLVGGHLGWLWLLGPSALLDFVLCALWVLKKSPRNTKQITDFLADRYFVRNVFIGLQGFFKS